MPVHLIKIIRMTEHKIIIAESSDIMLNGIEELFLDNPAIQIVGKAMRYNHLCHLVEQRRHDLVVLGPMITEKFSHQLMGYLVNRFPDIKIVQINLDDDRDIILKKIQRVALSLEV
jgi:DNA-binding NarL/FixJ family response regulator